MTQDDAREELRKRGYVFNPLIGAWDHPHKTRASYPKTWRISDDVLATRWSSFAIDYVDFEGSWQAG